MIRDRDTFLAFMQGFLDKIKNYVIEKFITEDDTIRYLNDHNDDIESHIDIRNSITALQGAFIYRGNINNTTEDIRDNTSLLTTKIQALLGNNHPLIGDVLIDNELVEWYYNGSIWNEYGQGEIGLATESADGLMSKELWTKLNNTPTSFAPVSAQKNVQSDWNITNNNSDSFIKNKPTIPVIPSNISSFSNDSGYLKEIDVENLFFKSPIEKRISANWVFDKGSLSNIIPIVYRGAPPGSENMYRESGVEFGRNNVNYSKWIIKAFTKNNYGDFPNFCIQKLAEGTKNAMFFSSGTVDRIGIYNDDPRETLDVGGNITSDDLILKNKYTLSTKITELENKIEQILFISLDGNYDI